MHRQEQAPPKVSVVLTTYNSSRILAPTLESLLGQTLTDLELIVVDDSSTDDTPALIESYDDPRIQLHRNQENQGISRTRNIALDLCRGQYIAMSDHDDISLPARLEKQVEFLDRHPDHVMVAVNSILSAPDKEWTDTPTTNPYLLHWTLFHRCPLVHSAIAIRRQTAEHAGIRYRPEYAYSEDYELYHQLGRIGKLGMIADPLVIYRIHATNTTHSVLQDMDRNGLSFLQKHYRDYLGFSDREDDVELVWKICNQNLPARDSDELQRLGHFLSEALDRFIVIQDPPEVDQLLLRRDVEHTWWNAARISAEKTAQPGILLKALRSSSPAFPIDSSSALVASYTRAFAKLSLKQLRIQMLSRD